MTNLISNGDQVFSLPLPRKKLRAVLIRKETSVVITAHIDIHLVCIHACKSPVKIEVRLKILPTFAVRIKILENLEALNVRLSFYPIALNKHYKLLFRLS